MRIREKKNTNWNLLKKEEKESVFKSEQKDKRIDHDGVVLGNKFII